MIEQLLKKAVDTTLKSHSILIIPDQLLSSETMGSAFGLALFLESLGKKTDVLIAADVKAKITTLQKNSFKTPSSVIPEIFDSRAFIVKIDTKHKPADQLKYEVEKDCLKIIIDSEQENFSPEDISFEYTPFNYDLIITVGIGDIKKLGSIYTKNMEFFKNTALININNQPIASEKYSQKTVLNLINQGLDSKSEIILPFIELLNKKLITKDIANWLSLSLIESTNNFRQSGPGSTSINTFQTLMQYGAQKETIIKATDSKEDDQIFNSAAKILAQKEFTKIKNNLFIKIPSHAIKEDLDKQTLLLLAREISLNFIKIENIFLIVEKNKEFIAAAYIQNSDNFEKISNQLNGSVYENCIFAKIKATSIDEAEQKIITLLDVSW